MMTLLSHPATTFCLGLSVGLIVGFILLRNAAKARAYESEQMAANLKDAFSSLAFEALKNNTQQFLQLAGENLSRHTQQNEQQLTQKKGLIDQTVAGLKTDLEKAQKLGAEVFFFQR